MFNAATCVMRGVTFGFVIIMNAYIFVHACLCVYSIIIMHVPNVCQYVHACLCVCITIMPACMCIHTLAFVCVHNCNYTCMHQCACMFVCVHT